MSYSELYQDRIFDRCACSYSNYGGVTARAEYCHEGVRFGLSSRSSAYADFVLFSRCSGIATMSSNNLKHCCSIRPQNQTAALLLHRLLYQSLCSSATFCGRNQEGNYVSLFSFSGVPCIEPSGSLTLLQRQWPGLCLHLLPELCPATFRTHQ